MLLCGCGDRLKVTHTYEVQSTGGGKTKTQRAVCRSCDKEFVATSMTVVEEASHGTGAYAQAKKIERGEITPRLDITAS